MLGDTTDWGKVITDLANVGATTAVALKTKPWKTGQQTPTFQPSNDQPQSSGSSMKWVIGGIAVVGLGIVAYSMLKKKRA
jgi:hypothetical protein